MRYVLSSLLIIAMLLGVVPDDALEFLHSHEHTHCSPVTDGNIHIESHHVHCNTPKVFIRSSIPAPCRVDMVPVVFEFEYTPAQFSFYSCEPVAPSGRGPPVA